MRSGEREELSRVGNNYTSNFTKREIRVSSDDPTGISEIQANKPVELPCVWYTLDGRRLDNAPTTKGLYIFQGKKVVIK